MATITRKRLTKAEEEFRAKLLEAAARMIPAAEAQAKKGKPALFRTLCRLAGRGPKQLRTQERTEQIHVDWSAIPRPDHGHPNT